MTNHADRSQVAVSARKARTRNVRLLRLFSVFIAMVAAFSAGFLVRGNTSFMESLGVLRAGQGAGEGPAVDPADPYTSLGARVSEVESVLQSDSLDAYELEEATADVLGAFADSTQDPYLQYYDTQRYAALVQDGASGYAGIGVLFSEYDGSAYAVDVFEGSSAQAADVREGDFVVAVDGDREHDWTMAEVAAALKRDEGSEVVITWRRPATLDDTGGKEFTTSLVCSSYAARNVDSDLSGSVGYIKLRQITQNSADLVGSAVKDLEAQGAESFVLDIRDNPGGFLTQAVDIASLFVKSGTVVKIQTKEADETTKNATGAQLTDKPLVVLVNGDTAASAEVLAAALQDNQRATLVGETTLGKGSVQVTRDLSFGGALRYTAARYRSPLGHDIDKVGVAPDVAVKLSEGGDNQKSFAIETAQSLASR